MYRSHVRWCFHCLVVVSGAAVLLHWVRLNSFSRVRKATSVNGLMIRNEKQGDNNDHSSVPNAAGVNGMLVREEKQGINSYRSSAQTATGVNGLMAREEITGAEPAGKDNNSELIRYTYFTKMKSEPVYIFGATVGNSTATAHWDIIKIRVSMGLTYAKETRFYCCIKYVNVRYSITQPVITFKIRHEDERLSAAHFTCRNRRPGVVPDGVALSLYNHTCREPYVTYRRPDAPQREPGVKLAICTKLAYGSRNAEMIIEFMEVYRFLGVDKFVTYFLKDLNEDSRKVLEYYVSTGILDLYYFEPAEQDTIKRRFHPPSLQSRSDTQLLIFDAFERMSGYTYFGIFDYDEFLIPTNDRSLKDLLADLFAEDTKAAGFTFQSKYYCVDERVGRHGTINDLMIGQLITTSTRNPEFYAQKSIYKPMHMSPGLIHTHYPQTANKSYHRGHVNAEDGYMQHFHGCLHKKDKHLPQESELIDDNSLADWSRRIQRNVENVRYHVFGSSKYVNYPENILRHKT